MGYDPRSKQVPPLRQRPAVAGQHLSDPGQHVQELLTWAAFGEVSDPVMPASAHVVDRKSRRSVELSTQETHRERAVANAGQIVLVA